MAKGHWRVGLDLERIDRLGEALRARPRYQDHVLGRIATQPTEADLALAFAAKEAVLKVLQPTAEDVTDLRLVRLEPCMGGYAVRLAGELAELATAAGLSELTVRATAVRGLAAAVAIGWFDPDLKRSEPS